VYCVQEGSDLSVGLCSTVSDWYLQQTLCTEGLHTEPRNSAASLN